MVVWALIDSIAYQTCLSTHTLIVNHMRLFYTCRRSANTFCTLCQVHFSQGAQGLWEHNQGRSHQAKEALRSLGSRQAQENLMTDKMGITITTDFVDSTVSWL